MKISTFILLYILSFKSLGFQIPLPEHPRPDLERSNWQNLNGSWDFCFDNAESIPTRFNKKITVPFPWGSKLSGVKDSADVAWYQREIKFDQSWAGKRIFINIGASDWDTKVWFDGHYLGSHQGGYTPFSFEITDYVTLNTAQKLSIRADDIRRDFTLYGKQGYGNARGIWQTVYAEGRGKSFIENIHFTPDIDKAQVNVAIYLGEKTKEDQEVSIEIGNDIKAKTTVRKGRDFTTFTVDIPNPHLWTLEDPFLYDVVAKTGSDELKTYFGMRKIGVVNLPGTDIPYVALNNKPIYLQLTLDQSYHPDGFYTFPSDAFMKNEIELAKNIGLNGIRTHIKVDIPRKLYWADKLGLLVMADLPNSWGNPDEAMQKEATYTLREMIKRDYNHPAIFSWIIFNETWGLRSHIKEKQAEYLPQTQRWVSSMYHLAKSLDNSRLAEDNSICCGAGHTVTDINSWHEYLPGYAWEKHLKTIDQGTYTGSTFHYEKGYSQAANVPNINSECGNVWGYKGSTGDIDWSYDYHRMMNAFRMHPKMAGWLYTEHHDVINEWNGYWRFDRSKKYTGLEELMPGMTDRDLHSPVYLSTGQDISFKVNASSSFSLPLFLSAHTGTAYQNVILSAKVEGIDILGRPYSTQLKDISVPYSAYMQQQIEPLNLKVPETNGTYMVQMTLKEGSGNVLHRNFVTLMVENGTLPKERSVVELNPNQTSSAQFSTKIWDVFSGKKRNGAGSGHFEYQFRISKPVKSAYILVEMAAKELFAKDKEGVALKDLDYMLGEVAEPSKNPNAYPMTDEKRFPSEVKIEINGKQVQNLSLPDDPADHRGLRSWHFQKEDETLTEAGSYGYLQKIELSKKQIKELNSSSSLSLKIQTIGTGGIAIYGKEFGRYGINPSLVLTH